MKLNKGDKLIWIEDMITSDGSTDNRHLKGYVKDITNIDNDSLFTIHWDNGRTINYTPEQIINMEQGHYSGTMILDIESIRNDKLEVLGI